MKQGQIVALAVAAILVGAVFIVLQVLKPSPNLQLEFAPDGAKVVMDGKTQVSQGKLHVSPGQHTFTGSLSGFTEDSKTVTVGSSSILKVVLLLNPNSSAGYTYLDNHPNEELHREALGGQKFSAATNSAAKALPLIKDLPFIDQLYRIDYGPSKAHPEDSSATAIYITYYTDAGKQQALQWLQFKGYSPSSLEIIYQHD